MNLSEGRDGLSSNKRMVVLQPLGDCGAGGRSSYRPDLAEGVDTVSADLPIRVL